MTNHNETEVVTRGEEVMPLSRQELRGMLRSPLRLADLVLGAPRQVATNIAQEHRLPSLLLALAVATAVFALPFGAALGLAGFWRVAALLLGGLAICVPSLHVFGRYLGVGLSWAQTVSVSLAATAVTSLFTLAFAPILAFLRATMTGSTDVTPEGMAIALLVLAAVAGIGQLFRLTLAPPLSLRLGSLQAAVLIPWLILYVFITVRLASVLGLAG